MFDLDGVRIYRLEFITIDIRNHGTMIAHNSRNERVLSGQVLRVYPGALLQSTNLYIQAVNVTVDVMGSIEVDGQGYHQQGMVLINYDAKPHVNFGIHAL